MNTLALITTAIVGCGANCRYHVEAISPVEEIDGGWKRVQVEYKRYMLQPDGGFRQTGSDPREFGNHSWKGWTFAHCQNEVIAHSPFSEMRNLNKKTIWRRGNNPPDGMAIKGPPRGMHLYKYPPRPDNTSVNFAPFQHWYQVCHKEFHQNYPTPKQLVR